MKQKNLSIVGATGAVGAELIRVLESRGFPIGAVKLLASARSAGTKISAFGADHPVVELNSTSFNGTDVAFFSAGATRSREFAPYAMEAGALVVDNSSAFRMDADVPLIVPEINGDFLLSNHRLVANPNCTAAILLMAVNPLRQLGNLDRLVVSTYQSASGAGAAAMAELGEQTADVLSGKTITPKVMPHPYAFNLFSHNTPINEHGYNDEEWKVIQEVRKISGLADLKIGVTCIRVPVMRAHSISVTVEFEREAPDVEAVREILSQSPGVKLVDDRAANHFPMPNEASGQDDVLVGRIRKDLSHPSAISMFIAGDQLLKGAALNAVQIAELAIEKGFI
jgi:aspartate-semialdehyde dehydrogenase